jgi:hypothetical protein
MTPAEMDLYGLDKKWGLVLIDHLLGEKRYLNIIKFAQMANIVIAHDAEKNNDKYYKYEQMKVREYFKYACKYSIYDVTKSVYISTLILSNFIDVSQLKAILDQIETDYGHVTCDLTFKKKEQKCQVFIRANTAQYFSVLTSNIQWNSLGCNYGANWCHMVAIGGDWRQQIFF